MTGRPCTALAGSGRSPGASSVSIEIWFSVTPRTSILPPTETISMDFFGAKKRRSLTRRPDSPRPAIRPLSTRRASHIVIQIRPRTATRVKPRRPTDDQRSPVPKEVRVGRESFAGGLALCWAAAASAVITTISITPLRFRNILLMGINTPRFAVVICSEALDALTR